MTDSGYCEEELKMVNETRKMFHDDAIRDQRHLRPGARSSARTPRR